MAGIEVTVESNVLRPGGSRIFRALQAQQLPFATAVSFTKTARFVQTAVQRDLYQRMTIRSPRVPKGIRATRAEKRDWPNVHAAVGSLDDFMAQHATGAIKRARGASKVLVPTRAIKRTSTGRIRASQRPANLRAQGRTYVDDGYVTLRPKAKGRQPRLRKLFLQVASARIPKSWPLDRVAAREAGRVYGPIFRRELASAVRTAK